MRKPMVLSIFFSQDGAGLGTYLMDAFTINGLFDPLGKMRGEAKFMGLKQRDQELYGDFF